MNLRASTGTGFDYHGNAPWLLAPKTPFPVGSQSLMYKSLEQSSSKHQRLAPSVTTVSNRRVNLLETILSDNSLIERLSQAKSVSLTLTLEIDANGRARVEHGDLLGNDPPGPFDRSITEGFVPQRQVVSPGQRPTPETDYRLVGTLGSGGTGIVYQAHQRAIDREVAVKVLRDELARDSLSRRRFLQEARTLGSLDHPNVIALHELGSGSHGELFYSMKRVDGTSWDHSIDSMSTSENIDVLLRVANAIRYAHSRGLIHRDIKPENIMIGPFGEVLMADWGLALSFSTKEERISTNNTIGGTPAYMAPELAAGDTQSQTVLTDVYLLGAVLFRLLTGHPPHGGATLLECIHAAANNEILPTSITGGWIEVASRAMANNPADRYPDVAAFMEAIDNQKLHQQSEDLVRRARKRFDKAADNVTHQDFSVAEALIREAIDLWPQNREAAKTLAELQSEHARAAATHGDYDLALTLLEEIGMRESELAARIRRDRQTRQEQASRGAKFSVLFTRSPDAGLLTTCSSGEIIEANEQFERLTGYGACDVVNRRILDINLWACPERRAAFVKKLAETGRVEDFETPIRRSDGSVIEISISANRVEMDGTGYILTSIRDITLRKEAQAQLKRSRARLRDLQHLAQLGTWELNVATGEVRWSDETFRIAGREIEHGAPDMDEYLKTVHPEDRQQLLDAIASALKHHTAYELKLRHLKPDGSYNTVIARGQPNLDETGNVFEIYGIVIDITRQANEISELRQRVTGGERCEPDDL